MRINQYVALASGISRRAADNAIASGRVTVGNRAAKLGESTTGNHEISLDGQPLQLPRTHTYVMLNKPVGYVTSRAQQGTDPTIYELLPPTHQQLRPVGRLDRDSSGLLLLTDDGDFIQRHTHPSYNKCKIYELTLDQAVSQAHCRQLETGVELRDGLSHLQVIKQSGRDLTVAMHEGRNRQLRRTLGALGYRVKRLHRIALGPYELHGLKSGAWQLLEVLPT